MTQKRVRATEPTGAIPYWVRFDEGAPGCVQAANHAEARDLAEAKTGRGVVEVKELPYPASPRLVTYDSGAGYGVTPSFCIDPQSCQGFTSCPKRRSCTE